MRGFLKFLVVGIIALLIDAGCYYLLTRYGNIYFVFARFVSLVLTFIWSYTANKLWAFAAKEVSTLTSILKYAVVNGASILLNIGGMYALVRWVHFPDLIALILVSGVVSVLSFITHRSWTFRQ